MPYIHQSVNPASQSHGLDNTTLDFSTINNPNTTGNQNHTISTWTTTSTETSATTTPIPTPPSTRASSPTNSLRLGILPSMNTSSEDISTQPPIEDDERQSTSASAVQEPARANPPVHVRAKFVFTPQRDNELALTPGDVVEVFEVDERGWTLGQCRERRGWFPITYTVDVDGEEGERSGVGGDMERNSTNSSGDRYASLG